MTYPRSQKQGEAGLEKPDGLGLGNPHLPNPELPALRPSCKVHDSLAS